MPGQLWDPITRRFMHALLLPGSLLCAAVLLLLLWPSLQRMTDACRPHNCLSCVLVMGVAWLERSSADNVPLAHSMHTMA